MIIKRLPEECHHRIKAMLQLREALESLEREERELLERKAKEVAMEEAFIGATEAKKHREFWKEALEVEIRWKRKTKR